MSVRAKELQIDIQTMTITVPVGKELSMILLDPKQGIVKGSKSWLKSLACSTSFL
ncbi:hypothetical protein [Brevibacillus choshinensis]|uniref:hypothetical protein n=1 Tax=Brevibacillus choshinensis TaxID=54911 RepID=UPI002E2209C2|nr:hypothetical protein [Brevibacillus choshinensis]MED4779656.1 hypothetical protein [Brevibacillus choshinensis]